jgi:hypothetical protein
LGLGPTPVIFTELGVLVGMIRVFVFVLFPQQCEGNTLFLEFLLDVFTIRQGALRLIRRGVFREQLPIQFFLTDPFRQRPVQICRLSTAQIFLNRAVGDLAGASDRPIG